MPVTYRVRVPEKREESSKPGLTKSLEHGLQPIQRTIGRTARRSSNADFDDNTTFVITMKSLAKAGDEYALGWVEEHEAQQAGAIDWSLLAEDQSDWVRWDRQLDCVPGDHAWSAPASKAEAKQVQGRLTRKSTEQAADTESIKEQIRSAIGSLDFGGMMKRLWNDMNDPYNDAFGEITYAATPKEPSMLTRVVEAVYAWILCEDYRPLVNHLRQEMHAELGDSQFQDKCQHVGFKLPWRKSKSYTPDEKVAGFRVWFSVNDERVLDERLTQALLSSFMTVMRTTGKAMGVDEAHWTAFKAHASVSAPGNKSEDVMVDFSKSKGLEPEESEGDRLAKFFARSEHVRGLESYPVRREPLVTTWDMDGFTVQERTLLNRSFHGVVHPRKEYSVILGSRIPQVGGCAVAGVMGIIIANDYIELDLPFGRSGDGYCIRSVMSGSDMVNAAFRRGMNTPLVDANGKDIIATKDPVMYAIAKTARTALCTFYDKYRGRMIEDVATIDAIVKQGVAQKQTQDLLRSAITEEELLTEQW